MAEVGGVGVGEVALRREACSCGKFLDAVASMVDEALRLAHLDREDVLVRTHAERLANRALERRLRDVRCGSEIAKRDAAVKVVVDEHERFRKPRRINGIDVGGFALYDAQRRDECGFLFLRQAGVLDESLQ